MPQVPTYNDRQLRTQALQPVFQNTPDVSSGARALAQGLGVVAEAADRIDLRDAEIKANEVDTQLTREWDRWENENRSKYTNQAADGYVKAVDAWWKEAAKTYGANLDGRAQAMVGKTLSRRQTIALEQAGGYEFAEKEKYADSTTAASINTATVRALKTGDYAGESQRIRDLVEEQGRRKNWDKDQRDAARNAQLGNFHTAVITQLAEGDAEKAKKYLEEAIGRGEVPPDRQTRLETIVVNEADNQFARKFAAENATLSYAEQIKKAGSEPGWSPQRREKVLLAIKQQQAEIKQAKAADEEDASDNAWQLFSKGQRVPETILARMDGRERAQLQEAQRARAERLAGGGGKTVKTSPETLAKIYDMMRDDPEGFKKLRMTSLIEFMAPNDIEQVARIQRDMLKPEKETGAITAVQAIEAYAEGLDKKDALQFKRRAFDTFDQFQMEKGRAPTTAERRQLLDDLTKEVVLHDGILWDTKGPAFKQEKGKAATPAAPVRVTTIEQARALPKGTRFIDPQGVERIR